MPGSPETSTTWPSPAFARAAVLLPITPEQIAQSCLDAAAAGAAIVHIHVRHSHGGFQWSWRTKVK